MRRLFPAALAAALVLLAGCSGDDEPKPKIAPTDSSSAASSTAPPTPTPTGPVEPTLPAEAEGEDAAAAEAFVRHYWEMVNYAQATGDVGGLVGLASESCKACAGGIDSIEGTYSTGGSIEGGETVVDRTTASRLKSDEAIVFGVEVSVTALRQVVKVPGEDAIENEGGRYEFQFVVRRSSDGWVVSRWDVDL